jgi:MFS transporter, YNFM family, putative membrane transport protein
VSRFGRRRFVITILCLWIGGILLTLIPSLAAVIAGLTLAAACGFLCQATSQSYVATSSKTGISSAIGLYVLCFYVGGSVGALLPGLAWNVGKWPGTAAMVIAMLTIMILIVWLAWSKDRR